MDVEALWTGEWECLYLSSLELRHEVSRMQTGLEMVGGQVLIESMYMVTTWALERKA